MSHVWTTSKCKRTLRPFLTKIHALNELHESYPFNCEFNVPQFVSGAFSSFTRDALVNPTNSMERLKTLKPFISLELYELYKEIYFRLKSSLISILSSQDTAQKGQIPKLSTLCCFSMGHSIAKYSQTSYYKLNNCILFENLQTNSYQPDFEKDIDAWLEMEPKYLLEPQRSYLLVGYIIHLIVLHSHQLYALIPALIHMINEHNFANNINQIIARNLFNEFWYSDHHPTIFNVFLSTKYWQFFIDSLGFRSSTYCNPTRYNYPTLVLDVIPLDGSLDIFGTLKLIKSCPGHPRLNKILMCILADVIQSFRTTVKKLAYTDSNDPHQQLISSIKFLLQSWLIRTDYGQIFNSLLPGNKEIFDGIIKILTYAKSKTKYQPTAKNLTCIHQSVIMLKDFYLFKPVDKYYICDLIGVAQMIIYTHGGNNDNLNPDINEFLHWLLDSEDSDYTSLVIAIFKLQYSYDYSLWDQSTKQVFSRLNSQQQRYVLDQIYDNQDLLDSDER